MDDSDITTGDGGATALSVSIRRKYEAPGIGGEQSPVSDG